MPLAWNANVDRLLALFDMLDPPMEDENLEAREQRRDEFLQFGLEQINKSLSYFGEADRESNRENDNSLLSTPSVGEVYGEEDN